MSASQTEKIGCLNVLVTGMIVVVIRTQFTKSASILLRLISLGDKFMKINNHTVPVGLHRREVRQFPRTLTGTTTRDSQTLSLL